ncbi:MAG TPA: DUF6297 family protein [Acidimicrobiales bacterium]|nr:DUF6297 family protein [Acidimicrobiales bacterium]
MAAPAYDLHDDVVVAALHELRATRKHRRLGDWNVIDALYRAYIAAIVGGLGVTLLSGVVGDERLASHQLHDVRTIGPAAVGAAVALAVAIGLRSGARGGPIALEAAEVRYVLLAPVDRDVALRAPARRQLRFTAFVGMVVGATAGLLAYRRFPGHPVSWVVSGAVVGTLAGAAMSGAAMVASGRRIGRVLATAIGVALLAWSVADLALRTATSPASLLGQLSLWPTDLRLVSLLGIVPVVLVVLGGLRAVGGLSLESAERRGRLVSHLRFAATFQDLRTVMLLRRQLAAEVPRSRPWIRLRPSGRARAITWRRDWRGILRWPTSRLTRLALLGMVVGLACAAAWSGTTPMLLIAGGALYISGLDVIEGLAQEVDHPDRRDSFPHADGALHLRHLAAPTVVMALAGLVGLASAAVVTRQPGLVFQVGLPLLLPSAAMAVGAAAVSTLRQPPDPTRLMMDSTGSMLMFHHAFPPALATLGPAALLLVKSTLDHRPGDDAVGASMSAAVNVAMVAFLVFGWVRHRKGLAGYLAGGGTADVGK